MKSLCFCIERTKVGKYSYGNAVCLGVDVERNQATIHTDMLKRNALEIRYKRSGQDKIYSWVFYNLQERRHVQVAAGLAFSVSRGLSTTCIKPCFP